MFLGAAKCSFIERPGTPPSLKVQELSRFQKERPLNAYQCLMIPQIKLAIRLTSYQVMVYCILAGRPSRQTGKRSRPGRQKPVRLRPGSVKQCCGPMSSQLRRITR
jgi:hypothetical protein